MNDENACADNYTTQTPSIDDTYVRNKVINALKYYDTAKDWHGATGTRHLYFTMSSYPCRTLSSSDLAAKELRYRAYNDSAADDQCYQLIGYYVQNCAVGTQPLVKNCTGPNACHMDHNQFNIVTSHEVIYDDDGTSARRIRMINHETGHALGLDDPRDVYDDGNGNEPCTDNSIMHLPYYCNGATSLRTWPTVDDVNSVNENIYRPYP